MRNRLSTAPRSLLLACALTMLLSGCSCGAHHTLAAPDLGDAAMSGTDADAAPDAGEPARDASMRDASIEWLADLPREVLCGELRPTPCRVQDASAAHGCDTRGRVVFDGTYCTLATGEACAGELGAFDSLTECAFACEAEHCNPPIEGVSSVDDAVCPRAIELGFCQASWLSLVSLAGCPGFPQVACRPNFDVPGALSCEQEVPLRSDDGPLVRAVTLLPSTLATWCIFSGP